MKETVCRGEVARLTEHGERRIFAALNSGTVWMLRIVIGFAAFAIMTAPASANWWRGALPGCSEPQVLAKVQRKIAYGAPRVLGYNLAIETFDGITQDDVKAHGRSLIDRRYCSAQAWLSNGTTSEVIYLIEAAQGFASMGWKVQSCLPAYDPWRVYDAWCRSIRP